MNYDFSGPSTPLRYARDDNAWLDYARDDNAWLDYARDDKGMKTKRQRAILSLIAARPIRSQEELAHLLEQQGYEATQATVSRDIKELGLMKVPLRNGNGQQFKYVEPSAGPSYSSRLHRVVAELAQSVRGSGSLIVLRTQPGSAMMLASAIDASEWPEILGTVAGDDTVFVAVANPEQLSMLVQRFLDMKGPES